MPYLGFGSAVWLVAVTLGRGDAALTPLGSDFNFDDKLVSIAHRTNLVHGIGGLVEKGRESCGSPCEMGPLLNIP